MPKDQCYRANLILFVFHTATMYSVYSQINSSMFSRRPSGELIMNNTIEKVNSFRSASQCAARCSRSQHCTAFVYSKSMQLCYLGSAVCNIKNNSYPPDYQIYKSDLDYYAEIEWASVNFTYTEYMPPYTKSVTVSLLRQVSISNCSLGVSYGLTAENHLWVDQGCRGQFAIGV